ncbi:MAG: DMT family transporter [Chromatiales bacterium]|jgi:drug/metabolite transporter (DMT)-like permease
MGARADAFERAMAGFAPNVQGAIWMTASAVAFSCMGILVKHVGAELDSFQIAFFRLFFGFLVLLPALARDGFRPLRTRRPALHGLRAVLGISAMFCMFYAITHIPLAHAVALSFAKPLFIIVLAVMVLGERVRWRRWAATVIGFIGVLIMLRPGTGGFDPVGLTALAAAFFVACAVILVKLMSKTESTLTMLAWFAGGATLLAAIPLPFVWRTPDPEQWAMLFLIGLLGTLAQTCIIRAYKIGEATAVAPFDYSRIVFAGILAYFVFGELPDIWSVVGAAIIVASTLYIARREAQLGRRPVPFEKAVKPG